MFEIEMVRVVQYTVLATQVKAGDMALCEGKWTSVHRVFTHPLTGQIELLFEHGKTRKPQTRNVRVLRAVR